MPTSNGSSHLLRIAPVAFLNAAPLAYGLETNPKVDLVPMAPAAGAVALAQGEVDVALVPVAALTEMPQVIPLAGWCIGAHGPVLSVLAHGVPLNQARRVKLDTNSRTSNVLLQVLLKNMAGNEDFQVVKENPDLEVVIGDRALGLDRSKSGHVHDLAQLWQEFSQLPFVFALWAVHESRIHEMDSIKSLLDKTARMGMEARPLLAKEFAGKLNLDADTLDRYLHENLNYHFDPKERQGLNHFLQLGHQMGLLPNAELNIKE